MTPDELMRSYYAAYNAEDAEALGRHLTDDVALISAAGTQTGREAYLGTYRFMTGQFVDRMTPTAIAVDGDSATVRIHDSLTARAHIADFMGHTLSEGQTIVLDLVGRYSFVAGRIARIEIAPAAADA